MSTPTIPRSSHHVYAIQKAPAAAGTNSDSGHPGRAAQRPDAAVGSTSPQANSVPSPSQATPAGDQLPGSARTVLTPKDEASAREQTEDGSAAKVPATPTGESLVDPFLALAADVLDDTEKTRIANQNRLRQLTRSVEDSDGEERGFGLDLSHPDVARLSALVDALVQIEHQAGLNLKRLLRQHPLGPWVLAQRGVGEKQAARLLAVIGDPYLGPDDQPRTVSQLWAYCGHGDPARRKFKGMTQADLFTLGNPVAKSRLWLISCAVLKAQGPLTEVYYERKAATVDREHARDCVRCGPSGHPALVGSPWSDAHRHADALRVTGKHILRDLWLEARRIHQEKEEI